MTKKVAQGAEERGEGICRTCLAPIWNEGGTIKHQKRDTGWSDRIERGGDSLVCFTAIEYRHVPLTGREAYIYDVAKQRGQEEVVMSELESATYKRSLKLREAEAVIEEALDVVKSGSVPLGQPEARHWDRLLAESRRVLRGYEPWVPETGTPPRAEPMRNVSNGHVWPCRLFYSGNWNTNRATVNCSTPAVCEAPNQSVRDDGHDGWCGCERCEPNQSDGSES